MPDAPRCTRISSRDSVNLAVVQLPMIVINEGNYYILSKEERKSNE